jgi:hypothetical protein
VLQNLGTDCQCVSAQYRSLMCVEIQSKYTHKQMGIFRELIYSRNMSRVGKILQYPNLR